jgi:signal peptidase I
MILARVKKEHWRDLILGVITVGAIILLLSKPSGCPHNVKKVIVRGDSMSGVFDNGKMLNVDYGYYACHTVLRGDIVVLNVGAKDEELVKIVEAVQGDTWGVEKQTDGTFVVRVNGLLVRNHSGVLYSFTEKGVAMLKSYAKGYKGQIPKDAVLVFGNQPNGSYDSSVFGLIGISSLRGKVLTKPGQ